MKKLNHVVLMDPGLKGVEYGMLADLQDEIIRLTGGKLETVPSRNLPKYLGPRLGHGMRYDGFRRFVPKRTHGIKADVLWVPLMGPESFSLDLFRTWDKGAGVKILYLFDTMEKQLPTIRKVLRSTNWDYTITSFSGAKGFLENATSREWHVVPQGVKLEQFAPAPRDEKLISFCAYGRRIERIHNSIRAFCRPPKHYDFTTALTLQPQLQPRDSYDIYAWHLNHSIFNFCWPVETTSPGRVESFSPITCRWFEAAASGNVIIGAPPRDPGFEEMFGVDAVIQVDPAADSDLLNSTWKDLWRNRDRHLQRAIERRARFAHGWSWENRVMEMLKMIGHPCEEISSVA